MTTARTKRPPIWHRLRDALADISRGLYPQRAFDYHRLPKAWLTDARMQPRIARAEAAWQRSAIASIQDAGKDTLKFEYQWQAVAPSQSLPAAITPSGDLDASAPAPVRARAFPRPGDWKATAFLLERRFPREYGAVATPDVGSQVVEVIKAMAQLRASVAGQPPQGLPTSLIARPALPATVEDAHAGAHAREGDGETGETGTPR